MCCSYRFIVVGCLVYNWYVAINLLVDRVSFEVPEGDDDDEEEEEEEEV